MTAPALCGCHLDPVDDTREPCDVCSEATGTHNGQGWKIVYCPLHESAPVLLQAIQDTLRLVDLQGQPRAVARLQLAACLAEGRGRGADGSL